MSLLCDQDKNLIASLRNLIADQSQWSQTTFGTDAERGPLGALLHLAEEAKEAAADPKDIYEYADCLLLILDACRRGGWSLDELVAACHRKMQINKARTYPRTPDGVPSEHVR